MRKIALAVVFAALATAAAAAPQATCFKQGERVSGTNKICSYDCLGSGRETTVASTQLCPLTIKAPYNSNAAKPPPPIAPAPKPPASSMMCMKSGERTSGMNKICSYNCQGSEASITIGNVQLCPMSIRR